MGPCRRGVARPFALTLRSQIDSSLNQGPSLGSLFKGCLLFMSTQKTDPNVGRKLPRCRFYSSLQQLLLAVLRDCAVGVQAPGPRFLELLALLNRSSGTLPCRESRCQVADKMASAAEEHEKEVEVRFLAFELL